jgi:ABC-type Fe3+/spermidine/putrescine transport system ATPase subunit
MMFEGDNAMKKVAVLSGGEKSRVLLGKLLARPSNLLLLDEPMSAVDAKSRESLRVEFRKLLRSLKITAIYVTHNLTEALMMSDKIAVMGNGKIEQIGTRAEILDKPNSMYVDEFLGINAYIAKVVTDVSGNFQVKIGDVAISFPQLTTFTEQSLMVTLKPEDVQLMPMQEKEKLCSSNAESIRLKGVVTEINLMRSIAKITVDVGFPIKSELTLSALEGLALSEGDNICVQLKTEALNISPVS